MTHPPGSDSTALERTPWAGGPYSVKRFGTTLTNCDSEPVQAPGCVQGHGALLVLRPADLVILQVSENSAAVIGKPPDALLGQGVAAAIGAEPAARLQAFLAREATERNPLFVCTLPAPVQGGPKDALDLMVHTIDGVAVVELEATGRSDAEPDYYSLIKRTMGRLQNAGTVAEFCQIASDEVRALTGHDRVLVYRFHADGHGEVIAESRRDELPSWLGLHYPAEDIPRPARQVFNQIWIRPLADVAAPLAELVPLARPDTGGALTMTYCALRGASVMYTEYLQNMQVTAGLTLALRWGNELWGLIACHHYRGPYHVPYQVRAACELLAQVASLDLRTVEEREHLCYRLRLEGIHNQLVAQAAQEGGLAAMTDGKPALLDGLAASGAALYHRDRWWTVGTTPTEPQLEGLARWLESRVELSYATNPVYATDSLARDCPQGAALASVASGLLAFSLSRSRRMLMMWFRPETVQTVRWGGNPHDMPKVLGPHGPRLTPRKSFELFLESVRGRSLPWLRVEIESAARLRMLVMELVVSRAERLAELNADLARSNEELDAFAYVASHDLKEPLRGIHRYAHQLLETAYEADEEQRRRLEGLMRLTLRMDSLLDSLLHFSRVGRVELIFELADLDSVVAEALEIVGSRVEGADVRIPRPLPIVRCDRVRCREVFVNLLSNALKYNDKVQRLIEVGYIAAGEDAPRPRCPAEAAAHPIFYVRDNGIGIHPRHFDQVFKMFKRLHGKEEFGGGTGAGLTIVKKLVERHQGQVWLDSTPGAGTTFYFTLPSKEDA